MASSVDNSNTAVNGHAQHHTTDDNVVQPSPFGPSSMDLSRHMSMPDISMNQMQYDINHAQQTPMSQFGTGQLYSTSYSPMQEFPTPITGGQMSGQVYDPQLVAMNQQMVASEMMPEAFGQQPNTNNLVDHPPDILQFWLSQADDNFGYASMNFPDPPDDSYQQRNDLVPMQPPPRPTTVSEVSDATSTSNIPNERFARVESCWRAETDRTQRMGPTLWEDVLASPGHNLFTAPNTSAPPAMSKSDSRWGIGAELKQRLDMEFGMSAHRDAETGQDSFPRPNNLGVPPPEVLDICLDAYFRRFHSLAPFVHMPTFVASSAPLPLLYAMCLVGLSAVKQNVGGNYMKHAFKNILRRVMRDLATDATTTTPAGRKLSTYAAGCLTLNLAALSGDQDQIAQAQVLHASLLSSAQKQGLFSVQEVRLDRSWALSKDDQAKWSGWTRLDSVKRLTVCLLTTDWWFSAYSSTSPTVRPESISICIPAHNDLFKAESYTSWKALMDSGKYKLTFPLLRPRTFNLRGSLDSLICMDPPLHAFGQYTLLSIIKLCQCDAQHRHFLLSDDWDRHDHLIPWRSFSDDLRGRSLVHVVVGLSSIITATPKITDLNALILWHNICMTINSNVQIFELAAGREGAGPASKALADITEWTQTSSARRACIHAAQIFKLLHDRKVSDPISIHTLTALFYAGLVLGLYLFVVSVDENAPATPPVYDVLDEVDWILVGDAGMVEDASPVNTPGANAFDSAKSSVPAVAFIENGGTIALGGHVAAGGYMSARRTFLDFAHLMDEMGVWKPKALSKILHIMSDVLEEGT